MSEQPEQAQENAVVEALPAGAQVFGSPETNGDSEGAANAPEPFQDEEIELDRALILGKDTRKMKRIACPKWGGHVWIRDMGGVGRDEFEVGTTMQGAKNMHNVRAKLLAVCLCNSKGERLFTVEDVEALGEKDAATIAMLYGEASRLNFVSEKDVEELAKNSGGGATSTT